MTGTLPPTHDLLTRLREPDTTVDDVIEFGHNTGRWTALDVGEAIRDNGLKVDNYGQAVPRPGSSAAVGPNPRQALISRGLGHPAPSVRRAAAQAQTALERLEAALLAEQARDRVRSQLRPNGKPTAAGKAARSAEKPIEHGTRRGWFQHRKRQQWPPCAHCAAAYQASKTTPPAA